MLWATSAPVAGARLVWLRLTDPHGQTALAPILFAYLDGDAGVGRPVSRSRGLPCGLSLALILAEPAARIAAALLERRPVSTVSRPPGW